MLESLGGARSGSSLVLALFVFGPERLPGCGEAGKGRAQAAAYVKGMTADRRPSWDPISATSTALAQPQTFIARNCSRTTTRGPGLGRPRSRAAPPPARRAGPVGPDTT